MGFSTKQMLTSKAQSSHKRTTGVVEHYIDQEEENESRDMYQKVFVSKY